MKQKCVKIKISFLFATLTFHLTLCLKKYFFFQSMQTNKQTIFNVELNEQLQQFFPSETTRRTL